MAVMSRRSITIAFCFLMLNTVTAINLNPKNSNTPPCGTYGQESCITHSPPANQHKRPCNPEEHCRGNEGLPASETESKSEVQASVTTKTVQDYVLLQLALLLVFAWNFDYYYLWEMLIGLCEFLTEHKEQSKLKEKEAKKQTKAQKSYDSDENKNGKEAKLSSLPDDCQKQMKAISSEEEISDWGLFVLGQQVLSYVKNNKVEPQQFDLFVTLSWRIWSHRNAVVHSDHNRDACLDPMQIVKFSTAYLADFQALHVNYQYSVSTFSMMTVWTPPTHDYVAKLNFDAAISNENQRIGIGIVVRNAQGEVLACSSVPKQGGSDSYLAESLALQEAVRFAQEMGFFKVVIEGDSLQVITAIKSLIKITPQLVGS